MSFIEKDLRDLENAVKLLEQGTITEVMTQVVGKPVEYLMDRFPQAAEKKINSIVEKALHKAADVALWSLHNELSQDASTKTNKLFAAVSGAVGGAFGFTALAFELPVSMTIMLRSVADIARSEGFDLDKVETKQACLEVFALGGRSEDDDSVEIAYYSTRFFTAEAMQVMSKELTEIAAKEVAKQTAKQTSEHLFSQLASTQTGKGFATLIEKIAARFGVALTEKAVAQTVPIIGAVAGATLNTMFTDYYQDMARGHFIVKRLEKKYGFELVKAEYTKFLNPAMV